MTRHDTAAGTTLSEGLNHEAEPISAETLAREAAEDRADNLADDLTETRAALKKANELIESEEIHTTCDADLEAAKTQTRIARQMLACSLVITAIAVLISLLK